MTQKPFDLADAGFVSDGSGDCVYCFHCGLYLEEWNKKDIPKKEHAIWNPDCQYVKMVKGLYGEFSSRLADGVTPRKMFSAYMKGSDDLLSHTIDAYALPPHPGLLLESEHRNPLQLQSQGHKRKP
ncbi:baculoviral IAP repeat-containing protein 7-like [Penaeus monodon]|uniref:baculoviral IAP repeat-containing protein 7-like n=1 Tax=Penaeus monodon TaxID=6687 RepID=UPI0018A6DC6F|nr:baculoviral IAP repeat-containing protein 7-like [Penaeus monodon]